MIPDILKPVAHDNPRLRFTVEAEAAHSAARACAFATLHNEVRTPVFMPVATVAALRTQDTASVEAAGFPVLLANTYHLYLRPGLEVFRGIGGIHRFMNWPRSILTDSGGFQIFSLPGSVRITEEGASFKSYLDGREILFSPESSIGAQRVIGSDIMMALDQCVSSKAQERECRSAVDTTARWAERSLAARGDSPQALFGIVQGACSPSLRRTSAAQITALPFDGFAIGGLAVGESALEREDMTSLTAALLPRERPRYLMGVGTPLDLLEAVHRGVDMFDCIIPTAYAMQGVAFTSRGIIELRRGVHKLSDRPLDEGCSCDACSRYSRAYLHHLIKTGEYFGASLVGRHNLLFYRDLMNAMRAAILDGTFRDFYNGRRELLALVDGEHPPLPPRRKYRRNRGELGGYEVVRQGAGFHSIRHRASGEIMHSVTEPLTEAKRLYADQANLEFELSKTGADDLLIWDVGLGAGTNAMATIFEYERLSAGGELPRGLRIVSFENNLDSLRLALRNPSLFPHVRHAAPAAILREGTWRWGRCSWQLVAGDFLETVAGAPRPDVIYYDPFSLHTDTGLWGLAAFRNVHARCGEPPARLFTYSASTRVRAALLAAGFFVGKGAPAGPKEQTTAALSSLAAGTAGIELLGADWLARWERSEARVNATGSPEEAALVERLVREHPQFR